jgi:hypothetical protein
VSHYRIGKLWVWSSKKALVVCDICNRFAKFANDKADVHLEAMREDFRIKYMQEPKP